MISWKWCKVMPSDPEKGVGGLILAKSDQLFDLPFPKSIIMYKHVETWRLSSRDTQKLHPARQILKDRIDGALHEWETRTVEMPNHT